MSDEAVMSARALRFGVLFGLALYAAIYGVIRLVVLMAT